MNQLNQRTIAVKLYLDADDYVSAKAKCLIAGISMSQAGRSALHHWQPDSTRRAVIGHMPKVGLKRPLSLPGFRTTRGGAPTPHLRV